MCIMISCDPFPHRFFLVEERKKMDENLVLEQRDRDVGGWHFSS